MAEAGWMQALGVTAFIVSTDQGFMRQAAARALSDFHQQKA
jgi:2-keto-3-deoxy-L-rhamnonate aldolase RhmA